MNKDMTVLREIQLMELDILVKFDTFCREHHLSYTLLGGTLLGAVRHSGFIPWDDDIDVAMPRPDYERFLQLTEGNGLGPGLSVISGDRDPAFSLPFAKVVDDNVFIAVDGRYHDSEGSNLWIDVIPLDGLGVSYEGAKRTMDKAVTCHKGIARATSVPWKMRAGEHGITGYLKCFYRYIFRLVGFEHYKRKLIDLAKSNDFNASRYAAIVVWGQYGYGEIMDREKLLRFDEVEFEGHRFKRMGTWNDYLSGVYGDYMQLPPIEKRVCPHDFRIIRK